MPHEILLQFTFKGHLINKQRIYKVFLVRAEFPAIKRSPCQAHMAIPFFLSFLPYMKLYVAVHDWSSTTWPGQKQSDNICCYLLFRVVVPSLPAWTCTDLPGSMFFCAGVLERNNIYHVQPIIMLSFGICMTLAMGQRNRVLCLQIPEAHGTSSDIPLLHQMTPVPYERTLLSLLLPETLRASYDVQMNLRGINLARRPITINFKSVRDSTMSQKNASSLFGIIVGPLLCMQ